MNQQMIRAHVLTPTVDSAPFWDGCTQEKLLLQACDACKGLIYFARRTCPRCGAGSLRWTEASGQGQVFSFSQVQVSFYGPEWDSEVPYTVALIDLAEGPRMLSRMVGDTDGIAVGDPVHVVFITVGDRKLPFFQRSS
jgi:hypothetical protein